jgi:hypothetical protein
MTTIIYSERFSNSNSSTQRKTNCSQKLQRLWLWAFFPSTIDFTKTFSELDVQRPTSFSPNEEIKKEIGVSFAFLSSSYLTVSIGRDCIGSWN